MAEDADTPPPLPSSGPPGETEFLSEEDAPRTRSEKFKALQKMLSSSSTMYGAPKSSKSPVPAPPTKRPRVVDEEPPLGSPPKLVHATRDRPRRKVRPPTRSSTSLSAEAPPTEDEGLTVDEGPPLPPSSIPPLFPPEEEPPLPPEGPPLLPPSDSPEDEEEEEPVAEKPSQSDIRDVPLLPDSAPHTPVADTQDEIASEQAKTGATNSIVSDITFDAQKSSTQEPSTATPKQWGSIPSSPPFSTISPRAVSPATYVNSGNSDAGKIVIGSFSERLKKIRANRATKGLSASPFSKTSWSPKNDSPTTTTTTTTTERYTKTPPSFSSTRKQISTRSPSPPNANTTPFTMKTPVSSKPPPNAEPTSKPLSSFATPSPLELLQGQVDAVSPTSKEQNLDFMDEEDSPPALPPDLPPLPPPPESPALLAPHTPPPRPQQQQQKTSSSSLHGAVDSHQLAKQRDDWMKKSEHLDSMMLQPLPLLISSRSDHTQQPASSTPMQPSHHQPQNSSSESIPSLPDSPPPALPDAPPPDLPASLPPDLMPLSDEDSAPQTTTGGDSAHKYSVVSEKQGVDLRRHRNDMTSEKRRSAFDALVATEPTAEEKNEPKLSIEERRSLALHAAKRADGDTKPVLHRWTPSAGNSTNTSQESLPKKIAFEDVSISPVGSSQVPPSLKSLPSSLAPRSQSVSPPSFSPQDYVPLHHRSTSSDLATRPARHLFKRFQQSHPSAPNVSQKVKVISEGKPPSSPDLKFTRIAKKQWKRPVHSHLFDDLSSSASTGNIVGTPQSPDLPESSSLQFFGSNEEVISFDKHLDQATSDAPEEDDVKVKRKSQGLLAAVMSDLPPMKAGEDSASNGDDITTPVEEMATMEVLEAVESTPPQLLLLLQDEEDGGEEGFQGALSDRLAELERLNHKQGERLEEQLAEVREQQKLTQDLLQAGPSSSSFLSGEEPNGASLSRMHKLRPPSLQFERDLLEGDPMDWTLEEVCQWLELVGLGMYRQTFRDNQINGRDLLHADVQLFGDLGIESPEVREIFLAKIYELSNPNATIDSIEEDEFLLPVDNYNSEDWKKLQAAVNALKSPLLDESVELEPSAIGQFIHTDYIKSHSTPNILGLDDNAAIHRSQLSPLSAPPAHSTGVTPSVTLSPLATATTSSVPGSKRESVVSSPLRTSTPQEEPASFSHTAAVSTVGEWVAGLPQHNGRQRALTDPSRFRIISEAPHKPKEEASESRDGNRPSPAKKGATLPAVLNKQKDSKNLTKKLKKDSRDEQSRDAVRLAEERKRSTSPSQETDTVAEKHESGSVAVSPAHSHKEDNKSEVIKLFMSSVQEGTLYKSFLVGVATTAEGLVKEALEKANLDQEDPVNYCIWQTALIQNVTSRVLQHSENPLEIRAHWPQFNSYRFDLRLKKGVQKLKLAVHLPGRKAASLTLAMPSTATCPEAVQLVLSRLGLLEESEREGWACAFTEVNLQSKDERILGKRERPVAVQSSWGAETRNMLKLTIPSISSRPPQFTGTAADTKLDNSHLLAQIGVLERDKSILQQQLDGAHHQLQTKREKRSDTSAPQKEPLVGDEVQKQHKAIEVELQSKIDGLTLANRKLEEKLRMADGNVEHTDLLSNIQGQYSQEVSELTCNLRDKDTALREMAAKLSATEEELSELREKSHDSERVLKLLSDRNQQINSLERDLAIKETAIQELSVQLEDAQIGAEQAHALHQTLQSVETTSKQQQTFASRTVQELKEQVTRLTTDNSTRGLLLATLREEKERMAREHQAKDALVASLEVNLEGYKTLQSGTADEGTKLQAMQRSVAALERAMAALKTEFQIQSSELKIADENVARLREALAKKEEQISLVSSTEEPPERSSLYTLMVNQAPHFILTAELAPSAEEGVAIKVANDPSGTGGCVVVKIGEPSSSSGLQIGDKILEINATDMGMKSQREVNKLCQRSRELLRIVVARQLSLDNLEGIDIDSFSQIAMGSSSEMVIERFKKLSGTLNAQLDYQSNELELWRQECDRLKAELLKYSTSEKDKESELKYLRSTSEELQQQLRESEAARGELRATLEELEDDGGGRNQQHVESMQRTLHDREKEVEKLQAAEKKQAARVKKLERERDAAIRTLKQHMLSSEDLQLPSEPSSADQLSGASREELLSALQTMEEDFSRHKAYLDQLLTAVIGQSPDILHKMGQAQMIRDQTDADSWI